MWPKLGNSSISMKEVITTSVLSGFDQKNCIFWGVVFLYPPSWIGLKMGTPQQFMKSVRNQQ